MKELRVPRTENTTHTTHFNRRRGFALLAIVVSAILLSSCGLRMETPDPLDPTPGPDEIARTAAISRSESFLTATEIAILPEIDPTGELSAILTQISGFAKDHLNALGAGLPTPTPAAQNSSPTTPKPSATTNWPGTDNEALGTLVTALTASYDAALSEATTSTPKLGRLLISVGTSQLLSARQLAALAGLETPVNPPAENPVSFTGFDSGRWAPITAAEDATGYVYEIAAAHLGGESRVQAQASASAHRQTAQVVAQELLIDATDADPRRPVYALTQPIIDQPSATQACAQAESSLAENYALLFGQELDPSEREIATRNYRSAILKAAALGQAPLPFPGLAETKNP